MAMFYGVNSENSAGFFNSMLGKSNTSNLYDGLTANLSDYNAIRNGSYRKLVQEYFKEEAAASTSKTDSTSNTKDTHSVYLDNLLASKTTDQTKEQKNLVQSGASADALQASAQTLMNRGSASVFQTKSKLNSETGHYETSYDTDAIYKAVQGFAEDYNTLLKNVESSSDAGVLKQSVNMIDAVAKYEDALADLGITIQSDDTLKVDETAFKNADMRDAKVVFNGSNSLAGTVYQSASNIETLATAAASQNSLYGSDANYINQLSGSLYNGYL